MRRPNLLSMRYVYFTSQLQVIISHVKGYKKYKVENVSYPMFGFELKRTRRR